MEETTNSRRISEGLCKPISPQMTIPNSKEHNERLTEHQKVFYADPNFMVLFRYIQILYSHLEKAREYSSKPYIKVVYTPPTHPPTKKPEQPLTTEEANTARYRHFVDTIGFLIHNKMGQAAFEDECREMFGVQSYTLFCMDRLILTIGKQLNSILHSTYCVKLTGVYLYERQRSQTDQHEHLYYNNMQALSPLKKTIYRILYNTSTCQLSISQLDPDWHPVGTTLVNKLIVTEIPPTVTFGSTTKNGRSSNGINHNTSNGETIAQSDGSSDDSSEFYASMANREIGVHPDWDKHYREIIEGDENPVPDVLLKRNLRLMIHELGEDAMDDTMSVNQLICCIDTKNFRPHYIANTEDFFWRKRRPC